MPFKVLICLGDGTRVISVEVIWVHGAGSSGRRTGSERVQVSWRDHGSVLVAADF